MAADRLIPFTLSHANKRSSGTWGPHDYDVMEGDRVVGRIFRPGGDPYPDRAWQWTITGAIVAPAVRNHGFAETLDEAKAAFAEQKWLALTEHPPRRERAGG